MNIDNPQGRQQSKLLVTGGVGLAILFVSLLAGAATGSREPALRVFAGTGFGVAVGALASYVAGRAVREPDLERLRMLFGVELCNDPALVCPNFTPLLGKGSTAELETESGFVVPLDVAPSLCATADVAAGIQVAALLSRVSGRSADLFAPNTLPPRRSAVVVGLDTNQLFISSGDVALGCLKELMSVRLRPSHWQQADPYSIVSVAGKAVTDRVDAGTRYVGAVLVRIRHGGRVLFYCAGTSSAGTRMAAEFLFTRWPALLRRLIAESLDDEHNFAVSLEGKVAMPTTPNGTDDLVIVPSEAVSIVSVQLHTNELV